MPRAPVVAALCALALLALPSPQLRAGGGVGAILVPSLTDYLIAAPLAVKLGCPILIDGDVSKLTFLRYYSGPPAVKLNPASIESYVRAAAEWAPYDACVLVNASDVEVLTLASAYASLRQALLVLTRSPEDLQAVAGTSLAGTYVSVGVSERLLRELGLSYESLSPAQLASAVNREASEHEVMVIAIRGDELLPLAAYYCGLRRCLLKVMDIGELLRGGALAEAIRENRVRKLVLIASLSSLRRSPGEGNLVNAVYRAAIEAYGDRYLKVSIGVITGVGPEDALALMMRGAFYDRLTGPWRSRLAAVYMSEGMALAKKIFRIAEGAGVAVEHASVEGAGADDYRRGAEVLSRGGLVTYLNLHGNPLGMAPTMVGPFLLSGLELGRAPPYIPPTIVLTFSCATARFHDPYLKEPGQSIALAFVARGAAAYVGAITLEFSSGIEVDTAHTELILTLLLQGRELGDVVRIVNNLHIASNKDVKPHVAAYTVLIGDPLIRLEPVMPAKLCSVEVVEPNRRYVIKVLERTPVIYVEIPVAVKPDDIKKVEVMDRNLACWRYVERADKGSVVCIFATRELSLEVGDFEPGDVVKVRVVVKEAEWVVYAVAAVVVGVGAAIYLVERRRSRP